MISTSCTRICTYTFVNGYEMYKLLDVVIVANSISFKEQERKESGLISNVRIIK